MNTKYQEKFGYPVERTKGKVRPTMAEWIQEFIRHSPFCVMATSKRDGDCDASTKGGRPGFVKILNEKQLFIPDVTGNKLFHGYGNMESNVEFRTCLDSHLKHGNDSLRMADAFDAASSLR